MAGADSAPTGASDGYVQVAVRCPSKVPINRRRTYNVRVHLGRTPKQLLSWLACFAILMGSLAPAISHALRDASANPWIEVCTALGSRFVQLDDASVGKTAPAAPGDHILDHCPYCSLHATSMAPPTSAAAVLPMSAFAHELPQLFLSAPNTLFAWVAAQPRAPPQLS